jgi:tetratricopeptide (TPR) repeat protein
MRKAFVLLVVAVLLVWSRGVVWGQEAPQSGSSPLQQVLDKLTLLILIGRSRGYALIFRHDEAIADMDAAIALDPDNPMLYAERGQRIMLLYEWDRALADYNRALELDPNYADAYYYRGVLHYTVVARELAIADFERYLELAPDGLQAEDAAQYVLDLQTQLEALED